ncbi:alpha/beta-hydrolase family protein [Pengzhenrongella frigida]|nr:alpha/beta-hydrolase family protein [Cellulomonas sp. HLT2-17]
MTTHGRIRTGGLDISARAGFLLGAFATGVSYQPNLLSRATRDQALITGVATATAFEWGTAAHSFLRSTADRLPVGGEPLRNRAVTGAIVDASALAAGIAVCRGASPQEHESTRRALVRLLGTSTLAVAAGGLVADALELRRGARTGRLEAGAVALLAGAAGYLSTRPRKTRAGSFDPDPDEGEGGVEDVHREVSPAKAVTSGIVVTLALVGVARAESVVSGAFARGAAIVLGGSAQDRRTAGRVATFGALAGAGWGAITAVNAMLTKPGGAVEAAHRRPPERAEVTGGPGSAIPWTDQSRESARWLSMALTADEITGVMGEPALQPIRVYASLDSAADAQGRAALLLAEIDRTRALDRAAFALFSPTGSGYINYVASETFEYLTRGNCASAGIQYSVLPSALSLTRVDLATHQTRIVVNGVVQRLLAMAPERRPKFYLFGESLGSQVSEEIFRGQGMTGPTGIGLDAALWIGTPAATEWRRELWGTRSVVDVPDVGPGAAYLPRGIRDWHGLPAAERTRVRYLLLQNGDDPVPKFSSYLLWKRPDWMGRGGARPPGSPRGTRWMPVTTFFMTFLDLQNALSPTPGVFDEGGHDYRREVPQALREVWQLKASDDQMVAVQAALRRRELAWEVKRRWAVTEAVPTPVRAAAQLKLAETVSRWTGRTLDTAALAEIVATDAG